MNALATLQTIGVKLCSDNAQVNCTTFEPLSGSAAAPEGLASQANLLVSCLMMTRGNVDLMRYSLACYMRQTYPHRELIVVVEPDAGEKVRAFLASQEIMNLTVFVAPPGLTIGDHRNLAAARARGAILVAWDDDDLYDPGRLSVAVAVLRQTGVAAAFVSRLLVWWPQRRVAAITRRRFWEGTMAAWRGHMPIYAPLQRGGDTAAIEPLIRSHRVAQIDCPLLYIYAVTGRNTWNAPHFEQMLSEADGLFEGEQFDELNKLLSDRLPVLDYAATLDAALPGRQRKA